MAVVLALGPALVGCVQPTVRPIVGPSGTPTLFISCADTGQCYELAGSSCPHGYDIQRARGASVESYLVHCKTQAAPTQQAYYAPAAPPQSQAYPSRQQPWSSQPWTEAPPPPPAPPETAQSAAGAPNAMSLPRPIGSSDFDLGY